MKLTQLNPSALEIAPSFKQPEPLLICHMDQREISSFLENQLVFRSYYTLIEASSLTPFEMTVIVDMD
jgi:hypothetical protein